MRWKSAPQMAWAPASRNNRMPIAAIIGCRPEAARKGWNTNRSAKVASTATTSAEPSIARQ